jgi:hypothetical protein
VAMAVHAAVEHALGWPIETYETPVVAVLEIPDELRLYALVDDLEAIGLQVSKFHEPDLNGELTSIAVIASNVPALRRLPLLFMDEGR